MILNWFLKPMSCHVALLHIRMHSELLVSSWRGAKVVHTLLDTILLSTLSRQRFPPLIAHACEPCICRTRHACTHGEGCCVSGAMGATSALALIMTWEIHCWLRRVCATGLPRPNIYTGVYVYAHGPHTSDYMNTTLKHVGSCVYIKHACCHMRTGA